MRLHPDKCTILTCTNKRAPSVRTYYLHNQPLKTVSSAKYLGVTIQSNARFNTHLNNIICSANRTLGFLRRNLKQAPIKTKTMAYKSLVRPLLEYASSVWDPSTQKDIARLEMVQRRAARFVLNKYQKKASVDDMLSLLQWPTLQSRRNIARLTTLYKITEGSLKVKCNLLQHQPSRARRSHCRTFARIVCGTDYRSDSFFPRTVREWNLLPKDTVSAQSSDAFRQRLAAVVH